MRYGLDKTNKKKKKIAPSTPNILICSTELKIVIIIKKPVKMRNREFYSFAAATLCKILLTFNEHMWPAHTAHRQLRRSNSKFRIIL